MTSLERSLITALVDAEFWLHINQPQRVDSATILALSHTLYQRAAAGLARTITRPSRLNSLS